MPAPKQWTRSRTIQFSDEQWAAVNARAESQKTSFAAVVREMIDLGLAAKAAQEDCLHCPLHCSTHKEVQA